MTSKISCNNTIPYRKYIWENIKQRGWLFVLSFVALFLTQTVYTTLHIENFLTTSGAEYIESCQEQFPYMLNGNFRTYLVFVMILLSVACAASGYAYLHQPEKTDFFHGFPLKRTQWFDISYVGGLLIFLIPYLFSSLCTMIIGAVNGVLVSSNFTECILAVLGGILGFLILYHTAILGMMLTGKLVAGVLAGFVLIVYGSMVTDLFSNLISTFLDTHYSIYNYDISQPQTSPVISYVSPLDMFSSMAYRTSANLQLPLFLLAAVIIIAAVWFAARFIYQKRQLEAAGNALAYPKTAPVIKILIAIPTALFIGFFAGSFYYTNGTKWIIICSILSVVLLCGIIEFIYSQDLRQIFKRKYSSLISILGVIGILAVMQFDLFGYDTWLPESSELESMALYGDTYPDYFGIYDVGSNLDYNNPQYILLNISGQQKDFESIYALAEEGILNHNLDITPDALYTDETADYTSIVIRFNKSNGSTSYRCYAVKRESLVDCLDKLCMKESYRKALFPVFRIKNEEVENVALNTLLGHTPLDLTQEEQHALLDAYRKDVMRVDIHKLQEDGPIGSFVLDLASDRTDTAAGTESAYYDNQISNLYIYDTYENTVNLLNEYGYTIKTKINPEDVTQMTHIIYSQGEKEADTSIPVTDPVEISRLLDRIGYISSKIAGSMDWTNESVEVWLKGDTSARHYSLY